MHENLGLFENSREANITSTVAMVEDVLVELGHFLNDCRDGPTAEGQRAWHVHKGSAMVRISLCERDDSIHLRAQSVVMSIDDRVDEKQLFRHLLSINHDEIYGAAFALSGNHVILLAERATMDLDRSEVLDLIRRVEEYADDYDDRLVATFGGVLGTGHR